MKNINEDQVRAYYFKYGDSKDKLEEKNPHYYYGSLKAYKDKKDKLLTMSTWTNFIPTILPKSDIIMLIQFELEGKKITGSAKGYTIKMEKLLTFLSEKNIKVKHFLDPVEYYVFDQIEDSNIEKEILSEAIYVGDDN